jgi:hypothetical protein
MIELLCVLYAQGMTKLYSFCCHQLSVCIKGFVLWIAKSFDFCAFIMKCEMFREVSCFPYTFNVIFVIHTSFGNMPNALYQTSLLHITAHVSVFYYCTLFLIYSYLFCYLNLYTSVCSILLIFKFHLLND